MAPAFAVLALFGALACGGADDAGDGSAGGYSTDLKADFVRDCRESGSSRDLCTCLYDTLEARVPFERFRVLDQQLREGTAAIPRDIEDMAVACAADPDVEPAGG